jgi:putative SOS response-associated peptidase YedK
MAMCYNLAYIEKRTERVEAHYGATFTEQDPSIHYYHASGFSHPRFYIITQEEPQTIQPYYWGLIPAWCRDEQQAMHLRHHTLNAMCETVFSKPSFRPSIFKKRCLVIVSGFYEWHTIGKKKYPFYIHRPGQSFFSMGGLYEHWTNRQTGEMLRTFSIITTPANELLSAIHNSHKRMPLILTYAAEKQWLDRTLSREDVMQLMRPLPDGELEAYPVAKFSPGQNNNTPAAMRPHPYAELNGSFKIP